MRIGTFLGQTLTMVDLRMQFITLNTFTCDSMPLLKMNNEIHCMTNKGKRKNVINEWENNDSDILQACSI